MKILSFDVSSRSTGWSVVEDGKFRATDKAFGIIAPDKGLSLGKKLVYFRDEVEKLIQKYEPDVVAVEDVFIRQLSVAVVLARFSGVVIEVSTRYGLEPVLMNAVRARSLVGSGRKKEDAYSYVVKKYRLTSWSFIGYNDISDSVVLGLAVWGNICSPEKK